MRYMLDTNILIFLIKKRPLEVLSQFARHPLSDVCISTMTVAEMEFGVARSASTKNRLALDGWLQLLATPAFDEAAAQAYGRLRATLAQRGTPIGPLDTLIAAHALSLDATLVSNNVREFSRVPGLRVEDWSSP